jgi:hypothetical protein
MTAKTVGLNQGRCDGAPFPPSARGAYMPRKSVVLVFIRFRVMARHHGELP